MDASTKELYITDFGCQFVIKVGLLDNSCSQFGWVLNTSFLQYDVINVDCKHKIKLLNSGHLWSVIMFIFQALNQRDKSLRRTCTGQHSRKQTILKPSSYQIHTETHWSYDTYQKSKISRNPRILLNTVLILWTPPAQRWSQLSRNVEIFRETEGGGF